MIEAGILLGLSREISTTLVVQTMFGTAKQFRDQGMHPVELRESVTSPGGTTIAPSASSSRPACARRFSTRSRLRWTARVSSPKADDPRRHHGRRRCAGGARIVAERLVEQALAGGTSF